MYRPAQYLDFASPFCFALLRRLVPDDPDEHGDVGWLLIEELLPVPEDALLRIDGRAHVAELLVEFEGDFASD